MILAKIHPVSPGCRFTKVWELLLQYKVQQFSGQLPPKSLSETAPRFSSAQCSLPLQKRGLKRHLFHLLKDCIQVMSLYNFGSMSLYRVYVVISGLCRYIGSISAFLRRRLNNDPLFVSREIRPLFLTVVIAIADIANSRSSALRTVVITIRWEIQGEIRLQ